jgi:hypothetical protein
MVTKGYRKGVYEWVTLGINGETGSYGLPTRYLINGLGKGTTSVVP